MYEGVVAEISQLATQIVKVKVKNKDTTMELNIANVLVILNQIDNEDMRTIMYLFIKHNCEVLIDELNSVLALSNLMIITEKCTE